MLNVSVDEPIEEIHVNPNPGPQESILATEADIAIFGGAAGAGKTWALLLEPTRHKDIGDFGAVIFRRTYPEIENEGGLWDESQKIYPDTGAVSKENTKQWTWPSGMKVRMSHMQLEKDRMAWLGSQIPLIMFDQLEAFTEKQFFYMLSRNRSMCPVSPYIRATCNPVPEDDEIGGWLNRLIAWWIDQETGLAIYERSGVLRWFIRDNNDLVWADDPETLLAQHPGCGPKSLTFIPGTLDDNPALVQSDPGYRANLMALPLVERERLLGGNWKIKAEAGNVFNREWFKFVDVAPQGGSRIRYWDKAATEDTGAARTAGVLMRQVGKAWYIEHVVVGRWNYLKREQIIRQTAEMDGHDVDIWVEQEPGSGGKESAHATIANLAGFSVHAEAVRGDKGTRAGPYSAQVEAGNVFLVRGPWNGGYVDEMHSFTPTGSGLKDQVDASSGAFNKLARHGNWDVWGGQDVKPKDESQEAQKERSESAGREMAEMVKADGMYWPGG